MKHAYCTLRAAPHYRSEAFMRGLAAAGWHVRANYPHNPPGVGDVLVIWNRYGEAEACADKWEKQGGLVIVAENGYVGHDDDGIQHYALSLSQHNGAGRLPAGDGSRWARLGIEVAPWRESAEGHIVIRGQRGIGSRLMASPIGWHVQCGARLKKATRRAVRVLDHPGQPACAPAVVNAFRDQLAGAHACVVWSSAAGVRALIEGVPVFYEAPHWICADAAVHGLEKIETPLRDDAARLRALERMAWGQWTIAEIAMGAPFRLLAEETA